MRVLIIEDQDIIREQVAEDLKKSGFTVDLAADGSQGLYVALEYPIDVAVIDLGLPNSKGGQVNNDLGLDIIRAIRAKGLDYPIIILTARDRWQSKVEGLEAGADDYVTKPFHTEELIARLRVQLRRTGRWTQAELSCGPIRLNTSEQRVYVNEQEVTLTAYEYRVLEHLMLHAGEVISKTRLTDSLYEEDTDRDSNVIEVFIRRLRIKLDPNDTLKPIETLRGRGYRFTLTRT
ncbi:response regulator transcription factor [Thiothrix lacustris]|jgi:two-component system response regulator PhoP|uniref:Response regulator transcription factor n=1 Tax=Thiothrix lacustris TaxID=525917 RepID=A0ABY9MNB7_9GAMM|nr:response regulator transcription factor [Thiothrix lacustris]WML90160.1 response regulator transcription factor [Thiothrix lacustris]WMP18244.1 response regulator transcription factor [Thiothrix lacustris]